MALSGCVSSPSASSSPTPHQTGDLTQAPATPSSAGAASPSAPASSSPRPTATPTGPSSIPIRVACSSLVSANTIYAYNPNFGLLSSWTPTPGSAAATALSKSGVACRWSNQTSGDTIDISAAHLDSASIESLKNQSIATGKLVPTYGDEAYFHVANGVGTAVVFQGNYWVVATSVDFLEPGDPADLIDAALSALK